MLHTKLCSLPFSRAVVIDIETSGLSPWHNEVTVVAVSDGVWTYVFDVRSMDPVEVGVWLRNEVYSRTVVGHNLQFDLTFLAANYGVGYPEKVWCTLVAEALLTAGMHRDEDDEDSDDAQPLPKDLKSTIERRLGVHIEKRKDLQLSFGWDADITPEMVQYVTDDVQYLSRVQRVQEQQLIDEGMEVVAGIEMACVPVFAEMFRRGIAIDVDGLKPLIAKAAEAARREEEKLQALLTPHVGWLRLRQQDAVDEKLREWERRRDEAEAAYEAEWGRDIASRRDPYKWVGTEIEGSKNPWITDNEADAWLELAKEAGQPHPGKARFVRRMMQRWRTLDGNARPVNKRVAIEALINLRSNDQKKAAIQSYTEAYKKAHKGSDVAKLEPPGDMKKRTLTAMSVDAPPQYRDELLLPLLEFAKNDKLVNSFGDSLIARLRDEDEATILSGGWRQCGTATGRPSCSEPNLLNLPRNADFRGKFTARPGHLLVIADFSQIELRILAELSGDEGMIAAFVNEQDLHLLTAADIYGVEPEQVTEVQRQTAKIINFGVSYGMAARALRLTLAGWKIFITRQEADTFLAKWRKKWAAAAKFIEVQGRAATRDGYVATALGRRRYMRQVNAASPMYVVGKVMREGANHPIQGGNADITKLAMVLMHPELQRLGGAVLMNIYDEIVAEVPEQHAWEAHDIVEAAMKMAGQSVLKIVPVKVDPLVSPTWSKRDALERK